jgi:hypothetical protein
VRNIFIFFIYYTNRCEALIGCKKQKTQNTPPLKEGETETCFCYVTAGTITDYRGSAIPV